MACFLFGGLLFVYIVFTAPFPSSSLVSMCPMCFFFVSFPICSISQPDPKDCKTDGE